MDDIEGIITVRWIAVKITGVGVWPHRLAHPTLTMRVARSIIPPFW